tara:strand:+ start:496 stop:672 length:177 start_codon:yes stop_codon:yes gene_type:complete
MPSLIQTGEFAGPGYPLVQGGSAIVALGNAAGGPTNGLLQEDGVSFILAENSDYLVQE